MSLNEFWKNIDKNFATIVQLHKAVVPDTKTDLFKKLLDKDFDVNYKIPEKYDVFGRDWLVDHTIFQLIYTETELSKVLINRGADFLVTDKNGSTILLKSTTFKLNRKYETYLESLKMDAANPDYYTNVILSAHVNSGNITNPTNEFGLSHFHVACMFNHVDAVKFFLNNGISINQTVNSNSEFCSGYSALHFAAVYHAVETVELLIQSDANVFVKDSKGMTPLHLLIVERKKQFATLKRIFRVASVENEPRCSRFSNYYSENEKIIYLLAERMSKWDSDDTGLTYFHVLCFMGNIAMIQQFLNNNRINLLQSINTDSPFWSGYTALHFAAHCNFETVEFLVRNGANLSAKDAKGESPFDICLKEFTIAEICRILSLIPEYLNIVFSDGKTKLCDFIHAMQELTTFEDFLKSNCTDVNMYIPYDSPICGGCTPLHLTIMCTENPMAWSSRNYDYNYFLHADLTSDKTKTYLSRINFCLSYNPEVTTRDARGSTPLHWAFRLQQTQVVHWLLERHETNSNFVDEHGLSHLHISCAAGNEIIVMKLLSYGANVNAVARFSYSWSDIEKKDVLLKGHLKKYFMNKGSTPLHFATKVNCAKIVDILIHHGADVLFKDTKGWNPLERIFEVPIFQDTDCPKYVDSNFLNSRDTIEILVRKIGDVLADTKPNQMLQCYNLLDDNLFADILSHNDDSAMKILQSVGITALHVACFTRNLEQVNLLTNVIDVNACVDLNSPLWSGYTPLHVFTKERWRNQLDSASPSNRVILEKLLQSGADVSAVNAERDTPIHQMFPYNGYFLVEMLENVKDYSVNPTNKAGYTHLHIASACGAVSIVEKFLENGAVIEQTTDYIITHYPGFTALHFAAYYHRDMVVDVLLKHKADVNWRNAYGSNPLHSACWKKRLPNLNLLRILINAGTDIHTRNMYGETPFESLIKSINRTKEEIELFLAYERCLNTVNPMSDEGFLAIALNKRQPLSVFDIAIKAPDIKDIDGNGRNAIHHVVAFKRPDWVILDVWTIDANYTSSDDYVRAIGSLINLGLNVNHHDYEGLTPLHVAAKMQNLTGIIGLLENGADINILDANGNPAFIYSWELSKLPEELKELDIRIFKVISTHTCKLSLAKIGVNISNREVEANILEKYPLDTNEVEEFSNEVEKMRDEKINDTSITFHDLLFDTGAISAFPYMLLYKRTAIGYVFKNETENIRTKFPKFTGILLLQYGKALARCDIIDFAVISLNNLVDFNMPGICSKIILRYLSNDELKNLISSISI